MKARKRKATKTATKLVVAVVARKECIEHSLRPDGSWASFLGTRENVIPQAIKAKVEWEAKGHGPYSILLGTLTEEVQVPTQYKLVKIKKGDLL